MKGRKFRGAHWVPHKELLVRAASGLLWVGEVTGRCELTGALEWWLMSSIPAWPRKPQVRTPRLPEETQSAPHRPDFFMASRLEMPRWRL